MIRGSCDEVERRLPHRVYTAIWHALDPEARADAKHGNADPIPDCACCAFYRGGVLGALIAALLLLTIMG